MQRVIVASKNPVKINAVKEGFMRMFPGQEFSFDGVSVSSGVPDQPFSDEETLRGAENRAKNARLLDPVADFWVGIEGGVFETERGLAERAWVVVVSKDGRISQGSTGTFFLPESIRRLVHEGKELGDAGDIVFSTTNVKQENGVVGVLTDDVIDRTSYCVHAVTLALIPFKNAELYSGVTLSSSKGDTVMVRRAHHDTQD